MYTITVDGFSFDVTGIHGIYIKRNLIGLVNFEGYMAAMDLQVGDQIRYSDGSFHAIEAISDEYINTTVYNLSVEDNHNYFVTEKNITVHNVGNDQQAMRIK